MPSSPPPDKFQREIEDIVRLAERRLEHQSFSYRMKRSTRRFGNAVHGFNLRLPAAETLGGWGLALLLISWLLTLPIVNMIPFSGYIQTFALMFGVLLLTVALISSYCAGKGGPTSGTKMWRGERLSYGNPYGGGFLDRLRRMFRGR